MQYVNDAECLGRDPAMGWIVSGNPIQRYVAPTSQTERFETEPLTSDENLAALSAR